MDEGLEAVRWIAFLLGGVLHLFPANAAVHRCDTHNWRHQLRPAERFIDWHESRLEPREVEPVTGAMGLGQLEPATYAAIGIRPSFAPCREIHAQRAYMRERYGSWANAKAHWVAWRWW